MSRNKSPFHYKRDKNKVEIDGSPSDVKWPMWFDLISTRLPILIVLILVVSWPKADLVLLIWQYIKDKLFIGVILFSAQVLEFVHLSG